MVALFDVRTGERIVDAEVSARIQEVGLSAVAKKLEPMVIEDTISFGNYFRLSPAAHYRIDIEIRRHGALKAVTVGFEYSRLRR